MKGERHVIEWIQVERFIVDSHVIPDSLLVAQMEVVVLMVRRHHAVVRVVLFLLVFFVIVLVLSSNTGLTCWFLTTPRNARISLLQRCHSLLFSSLGCRDQIFDRRVAFLISWLRRH